MLTALADPDSVARAILVLTLAAGLGLGLGRIRILGVRLGITGVLFAGLVGGHLGVTVNARVLEFAREFGLILFVYAVGLQVGPGFFSSLRQGGLGLNLAATAVVLLGVGLAVLAHVLGGLPVEAAVGVLAGATTNTPSLGAAQQTLRDLAGPGAAGTTGLGYALAYPFGVLGIILAMGIVRRAFRIQPAAELSDFNRVRSAPSPEAVNLEVTNPNLAGIPLGRMPGSPLQSVVISRLRRSGVTRVARPDMTLQLGDVILAVGPREKLDELALIVGRRSGVDLKTVESPIATRRVVVTRASVLGRPIAELQLPLRLGVQITRVARMELELPAAGDLALRFGDTALLVGEPEALDSAARELGNSPKQLNDPRMLPLMAGIALGVLAGLLPLPVPGLPVPVRLGLAGGPLVVSILLARAGQWGPLVWHMPISANYMVRELGISLFLASVGLASGGRFLETLVSGPGWAWLFWGAAITGVPLLLVAFVARGVFRLNFTTLCGFLAGSMTNPPALAHANATVGSEAPALAYATVYPLTMLLRVLSTQALVILMMK